MTLRPPQAQVLQEQQRAAEAVRQAEALVRGGYVARARPPGPRATMAGVSPELAALFKRG